MPIYLPKWLMRRCLKLWENFDGKEFTFEEAQKILKDDSRIVATTLSYLNKYNWLDVKENPQDRRRSLYQLKHPSIMKEMLKIEINNK